MGHAALTPGEHNLRRRRLPRSERHEGAREWPAAGAPRPAPKLRPRRGPTGAPGRLWISAYAPLVAMTKELTGLVSRVILRASPSPAAWNQPVIWLKE
jgi:hypothetical protein